MDARWVRISLAFTAGAVVALGVVVLMRRTAPPDRSQPSSQASQVRFGDPAPLPAQEPASDRAVVEKLQALENAEPKAAAGELKTTVAATEDPAALTIAVSLAGNLPSKDAIETLGEIMKKENAPPTAYTGLAKALKAEGKADEAGEVLSNAVKRYPTQLFLREEYAKHLAAVNRANDAVVLYLDGVGTDGDTRHNSLRRVILAGELQWQTGQKEEAKKTWRRLLEVATTLEEGKRYYQQVLAQNGAKDE